MSVNSHAPLPWRVTKIFGPYEGEGDSVNNDFAGAEISWPNHTGAIQIWAEEYDIVGTANVVRSAPRLLQALKLAVESHGEWRPFAEAVIAEAEGRRDPD